VTHHRPAPSQPYEEFPAEAIEGTISQRFSRVVARHPDRTAVTEGGHALTYRDLDLAVARVARALAGVPGVFSAPPRPVALFLEQGTSFITALLGVLRAGLFPVPLDPRNPEQRNRLIAEDSLARVLIGSTETLAGARALDPGCPLLNLDDPDDGHGPLPEEPRDPDAIATLLYTSGSTGRPKGVVQTHRNVLHNTLRHTNEFRIVAEDRFSLLYPCGVYGGVRDIFNALLNGACLCRYPLDVEGLAPLGEWLIEQRISVYCSVATLFRQFVRALDGQRFPELRLIKLGGEVVFRTDFEAFRRRFEPGTLLSCGLAATEVGAVRQFFLDHESTMDEARLPCGFPVEEMEVRILDDDGREVPSGERGEIAVRSRYISPGYWQQPELNARVFLPDPDGGDRRIYRSGDLGFIREDGHLVHVGRKDSQVKVRGNRVEIPEVEAALLELATIREAAVLLRADADRGNRLHGFVVSGDSSFAEAALRTLLAERLPAFMIPSTITRVERLPLLPNGKIDRTRLAGLEPRPVTTDSPAARDSGSTTEAEMGRLWEELLERPAAVDDDFFDAGGDSLTLLQLMVLIEQRFGVRFSLNVILEAPTVRALAARIDSSRSGAEPSSSELHVPITDDGTDEIGLSVIPIQPLGHLPPLFFVAPAGGTVLPYYRLAHLLGRDQPFYGLQVAPPVRRGEPIDLRSVARRFLSLIRTILPAGACKFGGWSFGGFVAWEMAAQSRHGGLDVQTVLLVDSDVTIAGRRPRGADVLREVWRVAQMFRHSKPFLRNILHMRLAAEMRKHGADAPSGLFARLAWRAGIKDAEIAEVVASDPRLLDVRFVPGGRMQNLRSYIRAIHEFEPPVMQQQVDLFLPSIEASRRERRHARTVAESWSQLSRGNLRLHPIHGNHFTIFHPPHIQQMAGVMRELLTA
jgi:amino acid adenylation domain-containing protein